jgi:metal-responsive CopG/Arc/MetJ family transcriptional regulator
MQRLSLSIPEEMFNKIDSDRGDVNRSRYVMRLIEKAYQKESSNN